MIIQHNIMAINSHRQLGINNSNLSQNLEKLSSGYRINRAADDAAGLAISEKMRAQITGLDRAISNAEDGASLIQTAEGALAEVHSMLNRMVELATQSANGTIQASDRQKIEAEATALKDEIDRISQATNFNGIQLLDGSLSAKEPRDVNVQGVKVTETPATAGVYSFAAVDVASYADLQPNDVLEYTITTDKGDSYTVQLTVSDDKSSLIANDASSTKYKLDTTTTPGTSTISAEDLASALEDQFKNMTLSNDFIIKADGADISLTNREPGVDAPKIGSMTTYMNHVLEADLAATQDTAPSDTESTILADSLQTFLYSATGGTTNEEFATFTVDGQEFVLLAQDANYTDNFARLENRGVNIISVSADAATTGLTAADLENIAAEVNQKTGLAFKADGTVGVTIGAPEMGNGLTMQVGDTADDFQKITVSVDDMSAAGLGISNISMASQESSSRALDSVNAAIEKVSVNRGNLGALQNRLEHTINNLGVTTENMTAAESRIRDVDMAEEMMAFTKNNVLAQAAQSMLAQANMQPQQVLQLLQ